MGLDTEQRELAKHLVLAIQKARSNAVEAAGSVEVATMLSERLMDDRLLETAQKIVDGDGPQVDLFNLMRWIELDHKTHASIGVVMAAREWPYPDASLEGVR
jgi:hypothetical protein